MAVARGSRAPHMRSSKEAAAPTLAASDARYWWRSRRPSLPGSGGTRGGPSLPAVLAEVFTFTAGGACSCLRSRTSRRQWRSPDFGAVLLACALLMALTEPPRRRWRSERCLRPADCSTPDGNGAHGRVPHAGSPPRSVVLFLTPFRPFHEFKSTLITYKALLP